MVQALETTDWDKLIDNLVKQGIIRSPKIASIMRAIPRSKFLTPDKHAYSSQDTPLNIGFGQTVSAPHMVAIMNEALKLTYFPTNRFQP